MNKIFITAASVLLTTANIAFAQTPVNSVPMKPDNSMSSITMDSTNNTSTTNTMPSTNPNMPVGTPTPMDPATITTMPADPVSTPAAPSVAVHEMPKADPMFFENFVEFLSTQKILIHLLITFQKIIL